MLLTVTDVPKTCLVVIFRIKVSCIGCLSRLNWCVYLDGAHPCFSTFYSTFPVVLMLLG